MNTVGLHEHEGQSVNPTALRHAVMRAVIVQMFNIMVSVAKFPRSFQFFYIINASLSDCLTFLCTFPTQKTLPLLIAQQPKLLKLNELTV